jgi:hypothetical protein
LISPLVRLVHLSALAWIVLRATRLTGKMRNALG